MAVLDEDGGTSRENDDRLEPARFGRCEIGALALRLELLHRTPPSGHQLAQLRLARLPDLDVAVRRESLEALFGGTGPPRQPALHPFVRRVAQVLLEPIEIRQLAKAARDQRFPFAHTFLLALAASPRPARSTHPGRHVARGSPYRSASRR